MFKPNTEVAFAVVTHRTTGDGTPKVSKVIGELTGCPAQALSQAKALNQAFDATGTQSPYRAVQVEISFIRPLTQADAE